MLVKLATMSSMQCQIPLAMLCIRTQDIQLPRIPSVHTDRQMPDLELTELLPQKWVEWFESDSEQPSTSALTVQRPQCTNKTVNIDTARHLQSQFCFYNCNVTLTNVNN